MNPEFQEFLQIVDDIYGLYLDATSAFREWFKKLTDAQKEIISRKLASEENSTIEELDQIPFAYGDKGNWKHERKSIEVKARNKKGGKNHKIMANLCIVLICQYWEYYRAKTEKAYNLKRNQIESDLMADFRYLRNSILKHKSMGNREMKKCKILKWFKKGEAINIDEIQFEEIIKLIQNEIPTLYKKYIA